MIASAGNVKCPAISHVNEPRLLNRAGQGSRARVMHVTEAGACNLIEQRNQETAASYSHSLFDGNRSALSHLLPYPVTHTYTHIYAIYAEMDYDNAKRLKSSSGSPVSVKRTGATALPQYQPPPAR